VPTADYINVRVDAIVNVKIAHTPEAIEIASHNFLNRPAEYIGRVAREVLEGNMREIVGQMHLKDMVSDRQKFAELVKKNAGPDLEAMGLEIIAFNVQNFIDRNGVIENLGVDNVAQISKVAAIAKAKADKEVAIAQAQAAKEANDAKVAAQTEIEKRKHELALQQAALKKESDTRWAEAEAAKGIQEQEQRKALEITTANANLARQEKEIELKAREVEITERRLEAEVKKTAEAKKYAAQQAADAELYKTQKAADAELFQRQKKAEADAIERSKKAEADRFAAEQEAAAQQALALAIEAKGKAEAEAARAKGEAEADAIRLKALAEAEGLDKKAEAMKKYGDAAMADMQMQVAKVYVEQLPAIAKAVGEGYQGVDKIVMLGEDSGKLAGNILNTTTQISEGMEQALGINLKSLVAGFIGGKLGSSDSGVTVNVEPAE
jgi:flotillin